MTTDLEALEALAKAATPGPWIAGDPHPFVPGAQVKLYGPNWTPIRIEESSERYVRPTRDADFIAAADPSTVLALIAELRQERAKVRGLGFSLEGTQAALSRAEETIEKVRTVLAWAPDHDGSDPLRVQGDYMWRAQLADEALYVLTEYDKQKGADRG